jgi:peptidyl-prolyl cis-trans isomerase D
MLQAIRNRAHGIFAWVMLILIGVPFALWGIQNYFDTGKEQPMAVVGGQEIFERDVHRVYEQSLASLVGLGQYDERDLKREALERLVREALIAQSADEKGMAVGDEDVRAFVQRLPYFQTDGRFDKEKYKLMLSSQGMSQDQFVAQVRRALILEHYQSGVTDTAFVTRRQLDDFYRLRNQKREIEYLTLPLAKHDITIADAQVEAYYRDNIAAFRNPERVSVEYVALAIDDIGHDIQPTEEDLKALYEEQKSQLTTAERRKVSHLLITVDGDKPEADKVASSKAAELRQRIAKGEDFAKVAKESSDDPTSAAKGGDLGFMTRDAMEPSFADAAFKLNKGEVSEPVKTSFGYHLIKVTEIETPKVQTFQQMRAELVKSFQRQAAENKFYELGQKLTEQGFEHPDSLEPAAEALGLKVKQSALFTRDQGEGVAAEEAVRAAAFSQDVLGGRNSDPIEIGHDKVYLLRIKEHQPATDKPLADVRQEIIARLRAEAAREETRKQAEQLLDASRQGKSLNDIAKPLHLTVTRPGLVARNTEKLPPVLLNAVFRASPVQPALVSLENGDQVLFRVLSVEGGSSEKVDPKELDLARDFLLKNKGQGELAVYLQQLRTVGDVHIKAQQQ